MRVRAVIVVVGLGQPPDVVVREVKVVRLAGSDLEVQRPGPLVPHPLQEVQAELGLGGEADPLGPAAGRLAAVPMPAAAKHSGERRDPLQHHADRVAGRLDELEVVAGVEPAAGGVDPHPGGVLAQAAAEVAVRAHVRRPERHRARVVEVSGRGPQGAADECWPITLVLVERQRVCHRAGIQAGGGADPEPRRDRRRMGGQRETVGPRPVYAAEPDGPDGRIPAAPRAEIGLRDAARDDAAGMAADQHPARACPPGPRHERGELGGG